MPRIPNTVRTISQLIEGQLPDFVRDDAPKFVAFLKAYYEWMETNGPIVYEAKILTSDQFSVTLPVGASSTINQYQDQYVVVMNGPSKGHTRKISAYDPITRKVTVEPVWDAAFIPPANTKIAIKMPVYPGNLTDYRDIDKTLDSFIQYFKHEFLYQIPGNILADKRLILKHIKEFYQARGTEASYRFLFRILFNEEVEFYYPKVDLFRASDARWYVDRVMRITTIGNTFDWNNRQIVGVASGATASVESVTTSIIAGTTVTDLKLSSIDGTFGIDPDTDLPEQIKIVYPYTPPEQSRLGSHDDLLEPSTIVKSEASYLLLQALSVLTPGENYEVGDVISITGGGSLAPASAVVSAVFERYYNGRAQPPPTLYYIEPYWGASDDFESDGNPLNDAVAIPGLYYFNDVRSEITESDLLTDSEIILAFGEVDVDDFFVGDEIAITGGTGVSQHRIITSYNGTTKIATVDAPWDVPLDESTEYSILHTRGGIKAVEITDFGLGFETTPTVTITSTAGAGGVLPPDLGLIGIAPGRWTLGRAGGLGGAATSTDSFLSSNKILQDSYYWQDYSYDLRFGQTIDKYGDIVKTILHPAGLKMFGSVSIKSRPANNFLDILKTITIHLENKLFPEKISTSSSAPHLTFANSTAHVIGRQNKDLDRFKFTDYPPNAHFSLQYPFPNQEYWATNAPGNTQISHFADMQIGTIVNNPNRRTKIAPDAYLKIDNARAYSRVGPVGQNRRTIARSRFTGFPPYQDFGTIYPSPNQDYFGDPFGPGNSVIGAFQDIIISEVITSPETKHSNFTVDADITVHTDDDGLPTIGNVVTYSFLAGFIPNVVYNVSPNAHAGEYNGLLETDQ